MKALLLAPVTAYLYAALVVWVVWSLRFIADGWRRVRANRRHPLRALERAVTAGRNP